MCGIAVRIAKREGGLTGSGELDRMLDAMRHRGPDGRAAMTHPGVEMGMVRLAIVDLQHGVQPLWNEDHTMALICNGEIYNHEELRIELVRRGHCFATRSDVEVILHLYEDGGSRCLNELEGIFALAIWDERDQTLFVARDRMGVKPLYWAETDGEWAFASELRAMAVLEGVSRDIAERALIQYHAFRFTPREQTIYQGVYRVPPGHYAVVREGAIRITPYWVPRFGTSSSNVGRDRSHASPHRLREAMFAAVNRQRAPEVNSAVLLSGGLDSSALLAMRRTLFEEEPQIAITIAFERPALGGQTEEFSEIPHAAAVALACGADHLVEVVEAGAALAALPRIVADLDEPIADPTAIPLWFAAKLAHASGCKVVYSGEGLDELFAGYAVYGQDRWTQALSSVPSGLRRALRDGLSRAGWQGAGVLDRSLRDVAEWYQGVGGLFTDIERAELLHLVPEAPDPVRSVVARLMDSAGASSSRRRMLHFDLLAWLPDNTLAKSDKIAMAHAVELRVPFLDSEIVDFALSCSDIDKWRQDGKHIVRRALAGVVPPMVMRRKKVGFNVPISAWIFGEWREFARETLLSADARTRGLYGDTLSALFASPDHRRERSGRLLFAALTLELWLRQTSSTWRAGGNRQTMVSAALNPPEASCVVGSG